MTKIGTFENMAKFGHSKVHNYLFIKLFVVFLKNSYFFSIMYHILNPYRKYGDEIITKNGFECSWKTQNHSSYVHFKSPLLYDWCMFIEFFPLINILIQVGNFNP
jgi:hypothetical protein